jgi:hypothetical protein
MTGGIHPLCQCVYVYFYSSVVFLVKNEWSCTSICLFFFVRNEWSYTTTSLFFFLLAKEQMYLILFILRLFNEARDVSAYIRGGDKSLAWPGRKQATATEDFRFIHPIYNHNWKNISTISISISISISIPISIYIYIYIYETRLASNEIFSPSNKIHWEVGRAKDLSALLYNINGAWQISMDLELSVCGIVGTICISSVGTVGVLLVIRTENLPNSGAER